MQKNDEMYQMFSKQGLMVAYIYLLLIMGGYTVYQALQRQAQPFWTFVISSQGLIWIIATQLLQRQRLGKGSLSTGALITLIVATVTLVLLLIVYGFVFWVWMTN